MRTVLINLLIRALVKRRLEGCQTPLEVRQAFAGSPAIAPRGAAFASAVIGGVPGEWAQAKSGGEQLGAVLYLHGGGYVSMSARSHRPIAGNFALRGFRVFTADYRLAPEHPFPAALEDVATVWRAMRAEIEGPIFIAGDSSGGGLALALMLVLRDKGEEAPTAACLFSPWTDMSCSGESLKLNRDRDPMQSTRCIEMLARSYVADGDPRSPLLSPIFGDMTGLPPLLIFAGDTEALLDDSTRLAERARAKGTSCDLRIYPNAPHAWPLLSAVLPQGGQALDEAAKFFRDAAPGYLADWLRRRSSPPAETDEQKKKVRI
jgi:epsilon-lactone hydrolase